MIGALVLGVHLLAGAALAPAESVVITPDLVEVPTERPFADLWVANPGAIPREVRVEALSWAQDEAGQVLLAPARDASVFPPRATILAGQTRRFRFSTPEADPRGERAYRISVAVLDPDATVAVNALVPAFVAPSRRQLQAAVSVTCDRQQGCRLVIMNRGTVRFRPEQISVATTGGAAVRMLDPWWVLAGGTRVHELPLDDAARSCDVVVRVAVDGRELVARTTRPPEGARERCPLR